MSLGNRNDGSTLGTRKKVIFVTSCGIVPIRITVWLILRIKAVIVKIRPHSPKGCSQWGKPRVNALPLKVRLEKRTGRDSVDEMVGVGEGERELGRDRKLLEEDDMFKEKYKGIFLFSAWGDGLHDTFTEI